ncbi:hypothetical protein PHLCEN_2v6017 [Hermanssonia centrifuga]|uniref:Uncharacterized protein n=1 Tax=Hermanssonia centrifuga TaxID=98765 RepID=A0A2R6P0P2_9APHY|nr:hypothetical protein PHLCEN_2v6017 [Hermanssonia centrifuga]
MESNVSTKRKFPPLYTSSGDTAADRLAFFHILERLKTFPTFEYEKNHQMKTLQPFFDSSLPKIRHPEVRQWGEDLLVEREQLQRASSTASQVD